MEAPASPAATSIMTAPTATTARLPGPENHAAPVDPSLDLFAEIDRLKRELNAILLAHYYQEPDIQDIADVIGDSLAARAGRGEDRAPTSSCSAASTSWRRRPRSSTRTSSSCCRISTAGCSLADSCPAPAFERFVRSHPGHFVISYINCSAAVKALSDVICTSSNAERIIRQVPAGTAHHLRARPAARPLPDQEDRAGRCCCGPAPARST